MENFTPISALSGGALIGLGAALLLYFNGRVAGISGILHTLLTASADERRWRLCFLAGILLGAAVFNLAFPDYLTLRTEHPWPLLLIGGFLVGYGTRMGGGCTSGHGVCGIARFKPRSLMATAVFMGTGFLTVYLIRHGFN